jgi:uncharacterized protein (DUF2235 family)
MSALGSLRNWFDPGSSRIQDTAETVRLVVCPEARRCKWKDLCLHAEPHEFSDWCRVICHPQGRRIATKCRPVTGRVGDA